MVFGFLNKRLSRKSRAKMVGQLVDALNRFDYEAVERLISPDMKVCLLYTSPSPRDRQKSRMPSSA